MSTWQEIIIAVPLILGSLLMLVAGIGLVRFPDVFCRMHAAGKAGTLGISFVILAVILALVGTDQAATITGLLAIFFQFLTTPAATHVLAHACYVTDYPLADATAMDELEKFIPTRPDATFGHE